MPAYPLEIPSETESLLPRSCGPPGHSRQWCNLKSNARSLCLVLRSERLKSPQHIVERTSVVGDSSISGERRDSLWKAKPSDWLSVLSAGRCGPAL